MKLTFTRPVTGRPVTGRLAAGCLAAGRFLALAVTVAACFLLGVGTPTTAGAAPAATEPAVPNASCGVDPSELPATADAAQAWLSNRPTARSTSCGVDPSELPATADAAQAWLSNRHRALAE